MSINKRFFVAIFLIIIAALYILPWKNLGINAPQFFSKPYVLGLDLQGWVELDYQVDLSAIKNATGSSSAMANSQPNDAIVVEWLKKIIDKRVSSLGLSEPNIQTLKYGNDTHIIVQIPTESYNNLTESERIAKQQDDIKKAKEVIGKVVQLEFKEARTSITPEDIAERRAIAENAKTDISSMDFDTLSQKYMGGYERVLVKSGTGTLPDEAKIDAKTASGIANFPYISEVFTTHPVLTGSGTGAITSTGYSVVKLNKKLSDNTYEYEYVYVDETPSEWMPAKTASGKILNDKYLTSAAAAITQAGKSEVQLTFNDEGKEIFAELTKRLLGKQIAIFVWGELLTAPTVQAEISNGQAVITGQRDYAESQKLANDITTGIVPAPIYLTSERTIDAKIGNAALSQIIIAGIIGLIIIVAFLTYFYHVGGLLAGVALIAYSLFLIALVKVFGVVLTLASIAGVILSIWLAIDANILIFERIHEALRQWLPLKKAISVGFTHSWSAIWDSHITSFTSAFILFAFGVSMIKGFGFMLGLGIVLSLFTAMWVSRILLLYAAKYIHSPNTLIGYTQKNNHK